jgi:phenylpyruvate tautomerase PptA (4-oxalocrotonate tautomerase family)
MPTYVCSLAEGSVNDDQKEAIARALSGIHSEETGAPPYFVQVVIEEKKPTQRFLGGTRVSGQIGSGATFAPGGRKSNGTR